MDKIKEKRYEEYKVIMCDDGTLLNKGIASKTIDAIKVREQRNLFGISTRKRRSKCKKVVWKMGNWRACDMVVGSNGVRFMITKPIIMKKILPFRKSDCKYHGAL